MQANEGIDEYVDELRRLSTTCEFGTLTDSLIKDRIILGIKYKQLKDMLFRETALDLRRATKICKATELAQQQLKSIDEQKMQEVDTVTTSRNNTTTKYSTQYSRQRQGVVVIVMVANMT